jgi:hypothetical protein
VEASRGQRVRLTCKCGVPYTLNTVADLRTRCMNERCRAMMNMTISELREYQRNLKALTKALELGRDYGQALETANLASSGGKSPYTLDIVEVPTPVSGFWQD